MAPAERHLRVVRTPPAAAGQTARELDDVGVVLFLLVVSALPLASALAGIGRWDEQSLGLGTLGVLLTGRELLASLRAAWRSGRHP